jgi:hypothetical protein
MSKMVAQEENLTGSSNDRPTMDSEAEVSPPKLEWTDLERAWGRMHYYMNSDFRETFSSISRLIGEEAAFRELIKRVSIDSIEPIFASHLLLNSPTGRELFTNWWNDNPSKALDVVLRASIRSEYSPWEEFQKPALMWIAEHADHLPQKSYHKVITTLEKYLLDTEDDPNQEIFRETLTKLRKGQGLDQITPYFVNLTNPDLAEEYRLGDVDNLIKIAREQERREPIRRLIEAWVQWISGRQYPLLVEKTADALCMTPLAVLPLVQELSTRWEELRHLEDQLEEMREQIALRSAPDMDVPSDSILPEKYEMTNGFRQGMLRVVQRILQLLARMSDARYFGGDRTRSISVETSEQASADRVRPVDLYRIYQENKSELASYAIPELSRRLLNESDSDSRESIAYILGNVGSDRAVEALARAVVGEERIRAARQQLLDEYYLKPSKKQSEEAAEMLRGAIEAARRTLNILQALNIAVFAVGLIVLTVGLLIAMLQQDSGQRAIGGLAAFGGLVAVLTQMVNNPLNRIQNAIANLVQLETAFTSFLWEVNLNSTFIQSRYVAEGILEGQEIEAAENRVIQARQNTMQLVQTHTEEGNPRVLTRLIRIAPASQQLGGRITIYGLHLNGDETEQPNPVNLTSVNRRIDDIRGNANSKGMIALNHTPIQASNVRWTNEYVSFQLPSSLSNAQGTDVTVWVSLFVDGMETNALPLHVVTN